jgi:predicted nucleotidyltransferase
MNLTGVRQAFESIKVQLEADLSIAVASVPAIAIMKMSAFAEPALRA